MFLNGHLWLYKFKTTYLAMLRHVAYKKTATHKNDTGVYNSIVNENRWHKIKKQVSTTKGTGGDIIILGQAGKPNCDAAPPSRSAACQYWVQSICGTQDRPWREPCLLTSAACLLPRAAASCYICCRRLLCETWTQARGLSGLEAILGRVLRNQSLVGLVTLWSTKPPRFTRGMNP